MGKSWGNPELVFVVCREDMPGPLTKAGAATAQIDANVKDLTVNHTNKLALGSGQLIVQPTQGALHREALVFLHKLEIRYLLLEIVLAKRLEKTATLIAEYLRFEQFYIRNWRVENFHHVTRPQKDFFMPMAA